MARSVTVIPANRIKKEYEEKAGKKCRVAAYCRVSTDHEEQLGSFANQVTYYTNYINSNPDYEMAGIYADEGISGTGTRKRDGFRSMIKDCEEGKIDLVITKSISRFARNTADCLHYARYLKNKGIGICFEKENIYTLDSTGELLFTILSSLAQEESRNISENTAWGIRSRFRKGIPHLNANQLLGYDKDADGGLVINETQAAIVRRIFRDFMEGWRPAEIAGHLNAEGVPGVHGVPRWYDVTIRRMLQNEKYKGDLLMQKTYTADFLTKLQAANRGELEQYFIRDDHEAIIRRSLWEAAQLELARLETFRTEHHIKEMASCTGDPMISRVFCSKYDGRYLRQASKGGTVIYWRCACSASCPEAASSPCPLASLKGERLQETMTLAFNQVVTNRAAYLPGWQRQQESGNALESYRAADMIAITAEGKFQQAIPELTRTVLAEMLIEEKRIRVRFLDGTEVAVAAGY